MGQVGTGGLHSYRAFLALSVSETLGLGFWALSFCSQFEVVADLLIFLHSNCHQICLPLMPENSQC